MRIERGDQRRRLRHHPRRPPLPLAVDPGRSLPALQKRPPRLCEIAERAGAKATGRRVRRLRRSGCRPPSALRQPRRDRLSGSAPWSRSIQPQDTGRRAASAAQPFRRFGGPVDHLFGKPHARHDLPKARMRPQTAPAWIEAQPYEPVRALGKGGFERCQRRLVAAEPGLYQSNAIGCNKAATSEPVQLSECGSRLLAAARHPLDKAARRNRDRPFGCRRLDGAECRAASHSPSS